MRKNYFMFAALAGVLSLAACGGNKSASEQAAADVEKIDAEPLIAQIAGKLADACSTDDSVDLPCVADKAEAVITANPNFVAVIKQYEDICGQKYNAKVCAGGYSGFLSNALLGEIQDPITERATISLTAKAAGLRHAAAEEARQKAEAEAAAARAAEEVIIPAEETEGSVQQSPAGSSTPAAVPAPQPINAPVAPVHTGAQPAPAAVPTQAGQAVHKTAPGIADTARQAVGGAVNNAVGGVQNTAKQAVGGAIGGAVNNAVGGMQNTAKQAVGGAIGGAAQQAVGGIIGGAMTNGVGGAARAVSGVAQQAVGMAVGGAVAGAAQQAVSGATQKINQGTAKALGKKEAQAKKEAAAKKDIERVPSGAEGIPHTPLQP